jgi:enoyl-CoA hydratase
VTHEKRWEHRAGLIVEKSGGARRLTVNRPDRLNAVTNGVLHALAVECEAAAADDACRVVVLTGAGRGFCAGADLVGYNDTNSTSPAGVDAMEYATRIATAIAHAPQTFIARLNGPAAGVGAGLAVACDLILASESSFLKLGFDQLGIMPDGGATAFLTTSVGRHKAMQHALLGDRLSAAEAHQLGLVARVWPDGDFAEEVDAIVQRLATGPILGMAATKRAINQVALPGLPAALDYEATTQVDLLRSEDYAEGVASFKEKRPPRFQGR